MSGRDIVVHLATNAAGAITSTAAQVVAAINANAQAAQVVLAHLPRDNAGAGVVAPAGPQTLSDNLDAASWELTAEEVALLDRVSARPLPYPYWHQLKMNRPRLRYTLADSGL